ncbi:hypothetical protein ABTB37_19825, partial [Acinetobacter baumannii]
MSTEYILILSMFMFTGIVVALVLVILAARAKLVSAGSVMLDINDDPEKRVEVSSGGKLLGALADQKVFLSSACGGG